ncbi:M48 family peptidase, partial [Erwinia amylovora]|nr:M48 family peptidase [Erwinia amylovora]
LMNPDRIPITLQQAFMQMLRDKLKQAYLRLERNYPQPAMQFKQRGTAEGTALLQRWEIRMNKVLIYENNKK